MEGQFSMPSQEKYQASDNQPAGPSRLSNTLQQKGAKKREIDKASRQRRKEQENKMKENLQFVNEENTSLKLENQVLMTERNTMAQHFQSEAEETQQLQSNIDTLNHGIVTRKWLVDLYSNQLAATDTSHRVSELRQLEIEISILRQTDWNRENWDSEKQLLLENIAELEVEERSLKLQHQALIESVNTNEDGQQGYAA
ncbi:uncharacterized protein LOC119990096 isoform X2 [Tripterygium wilfordii]|nr:uncharacterized protein LOC119990096 isoform X2 [Tripterygium wilfordii]XP_038691857.1 uncharacterized protein LOC119990096 isoform X2 [Tripterygium wilfordii]XP_038691858.1 uncharacterized protein LOC119990096 isoform X2 [Tripterygium wilfordii]